MKNKSLILFTFIFFYSFSLINVFSEEFIFNVTELEITNKGNLIKGHKRGEIIVENGIILKADNFIYNKTLNILDANGNVFIEDKNNNYKLFTDKTIYYKNKEIITTSGNSRAFIDDITIFAEKFYLNKNLNFVNANNKQAIRIPIVAIFFAISFSIEIAFVMERMTKMIVRDKIISATFL